MCQILILIVQPFITEGRKEGRKEMFYLTTHSKKKKKNVRLYGVRHMVKDRSDSEKGNPLLPHRLLFPISSKGSFICTSHRQDSTYHGFVIPVVEHWLEREIAQWVHHECTLYHRATSHSQAYQMHAIYVLKDVK